MRRGAGVAGAGGIERGGVLRGGMLSMKAIEVVAPTAESGLARRRPSSDGISQYPR